MYLAKYIPVKYKELIDKRQKKEDLALEEQTIYQKLISFSDMGKNYSEWVAHKLASIPYKTQHEDMFEYWYTTFTFHNDNCRLGNEIYHKINDIHKTLVKKHIQSVKLTDVNPIRELGPRELVVKLLTSSETKKTDFLKYYVMKKYDFDIPYDIEYNNFIDLHVQKAFTIELSQIESAIKIINDAKVWEWNDIIINEYFQYYKSEINNKERERLFGKISANKISRELVYHHVTGNIILKKNIKNPIIEQMKLVSSVKSKIFDTKEEVEKVNIKLIKYIEGVVSPLKVGKSVGTCLIPLDDWHWVKKIIIRKYIKYAIEEFDMTEEELCEDNIENYAVQWWNKLPENNLKLRTYYLSQKN